MTELPRTRLSLLVRLRDQADADAWRTFVDVYAPAIFAFARRSGLQPADASDLTQEVCRALANALPGFDYDPERGRFRGWVFGVVRNQLRMFQRTRLRRGRAQELLVDVPDDTASETFDLECRRRLFAWACERVKPTVNAVTWSAFWRLAVDSASGETVAKETGLSVAAVYLAKSRVLAKLRLAVADVEED